MEKNTVLIVDDSITNVAILNQILRSEYTIYMENDGESCIKAALELRPDVILLDIMMPGIDGFEVIKILQSEPRTKDIPVIFITGLRDAKAEERGLELGAADYIQKPFSEGIIKLRVRNQMKIINQMRLIHNIGITDALTGIGNRRHFNSSLEIEWMRAMREQSQLSFMIMDIDNFKRFNDTYGHLAGDLVLKKVAKILKSQLMRAADNLARWGGEEFAAILPSTNLEGARIVAEGIRNCIEHAVFILDDGTPASVTLSVGLHTAVPVKEGELTLEKFVAAADNALYHAKRGGRNRVYSVSEILPNGKAIQKG